MKQRFIFVCKMFILFIVVIAMTLIFYITYPLMMLHYILTGKFFIKQLADWATT